MITATDKKIYETYKNNHDGTMQAFIEWFERGGRRQISKRNRTKKHDVFRQASSIIKDLRNNHTGPEIAKMFGIGQNLVYQLDRDNHNCSKETAQRIIRRYAND